MSLPGSSIGAGGADLDRWRPRPRPTSLLHQQQPRHQQQQQQQRTSWSGGGIFARSMSTLSEMSNGSSAASSSPVACGPSRRLGAHETNAALCHDFNGNGNVLVGLTLLTRHAVDEGLMKCALQQFQHTHPQLTSRIANVSNAGDSAAAAAVPERGFVAMELPKFPLDTEFQVKDMLHEKFDATDGPLWRVQLITEATMDRAGLGFGPELAAIIEDDAPIETRWRYFLRYFQGKVNQEDIADYDEEDEGFRSFILMAFHPSVTDTMGALHLARQFLITLDRILEEDSSGSTADSQTEELPAALEALLPPALMSSASGQSVSGFFRAITSYVTAARKSPVEELARNEESRRRTEVLRGWLSTEQTSELSAMMEEDEASLHGVILAAALTATARVIAQSRRKGITNSKQAADNAQTASTPTITLRASNEANLRSYCPTSPRHGCLTSHYESDYAVTTTDEDGEPSSVVVSEKADFWRLAHDMTVRHNRAKGANEPIKALRQRRTPTTAATNEMSVSVYGDIGSLFRLSSGDSSSAATSPSSGGNSNLASIVDTWSRPLSVSQRNIRLEDVFHAVSGQDMGSPISHSVHLLHGRLNYIMGYHDAYIDQTNAFMIRDETIGVLRMATEVEQ